MINAREGFGLNIEDNKWRSMDRKFSAFLLLVIEKRIQNPGRIDSSKGLVPSLVGYAAGGWHMEYGLYAILANMHAKYWTCFIIMENEEQRIKEMGKGKYL